MTARALDAAEMAAFRLARLRALDMAPYSAHALLAAEPVAAPGLGTFAVDERWRVYMDPGLLAGPGAWPPAVAGAVLLHEVWHVLRDHTGRVACLPQPASALAWNLAADAEINDDLLAAGVPLPEGVVTPAGLGELPDGKTAEVYYAALASPDLAPLLASLDDGGAGCGTGSGGSAVPGELAGPAAPAAGLGRADADMVRRRVAQAVREGQAAGRGMTPAGLDRWASEVLAPPVISWTVLLRAAIRTGIAARAGRTDYTYARPARRQVPGVVRPAMRGPEVSVSVVVDTSGSMGQADLDAALAEIGGLLRASGISRDRVSVLSCDAAAGHPTRVRSVSAIRLSGGGGTDMRVGIAAALAGRPAPDVIVVLTDGGTPWPARPVPARLVCAVISPDLPDGTPEWAATVHIPAAA